VDERAADELKSDLGLDKAKWLLDRVTAKSKVRKGTHLETGINVAELQFNYDLGIELEIIRYIDGPHWHPPMQPQLRRFQSHVGIHLDDGEPFPLMDNSPIVQETFTTEHTSEYLVKLDRKYHYRIHEVSRGTYIKFIRRIRGINE
jgi:hypothetical protein